MTTSFPLTLVVVPTYGEYDNLKELTERIWDQIKNASVLIVDDASGDQTPAWVRNHPLYEQQLFLIARSAKLGLGTAYREGFRWGLQRAYQIMVQMDADLSHDPAAIPPMLDENEKGNDLVLASRYFKGVRVLNWPIGRLFLSMAAAQYVKLITRLPFTDPTGGFRSWRRELLGKFDFTRIRSNGYSFQIEMLYIAWSLNAAITEIPIIFEERHAGSSKMSEQIAREACWEVLRLGLQGKNGIRKKHHS